MKGDWTSSGSKSIVARIYSRDGQSTVEDGVETRKETDGKRMVEKLRYATVELERPRPRESLPLQSKGDAIAPPC